MRLSITFKLIITLAFMLLLNTSPFAQNSLLQQPSTGNVSSTFDGIELVSNGTDVVLVVSASEDTSIYAIDIADNNPADAVNNVVTAIPNFANLLSGVTGLSNANITIENIEVNPISKAVYVLISSPNQSYIVVIKDDGATVSLLNTNNITYSKVKLSNNDFALQDMTFGDDTLYVTSGSWTLDGELIRVSAPFSNNSVATQRNTSMFKTNWGGGYFTSAPLEKLDYGVVDGVERLMGVTLCAPGFSLPTADIPGTNVFAVKEVFNIRFNPPKKVIYQNQNGTDYLFNLHDDPPAGPFGGGGTGPVFMRIGEHYIDGTPELINQFNANSTYLRNNNVNPGVSSGLTDADLKIYPNSFDMIAFYDNYNMVVLEADTLKMFATGINPTNVQQITSDIQVECLPNPAQDYLQITLTGNDNQPLKTQLSIYNLEGKEILHRHLDQSDNKINIQNIANGQYIATIKAGEEVIYNHKFIIIN